MLHAEDWQACYRPDLCYSFLRILKMTTATDEMEGGDGMVAVVRGLQNAGLAVTLLEGCRRYTLMPNSVAHPSMPNCVHATSDIPESMSPTTEVGTEPALRCDSSAQATDGRYASIYKIDHCNVTPTSPPVHLTEFPPQRAELCPGHGNFEVGGTGSGEKYSTVRPTTQFRGGMSWPDRGSVCAPRPTYEHDPFANSLRKYPNLSPQRSSEVVERLVNYSQGKHASKSPTKRRMSPTRSTECNSNHNLNTVFGVLPMRPTSHEPEIKTRPRMKTDESPTREARSKECDIFCPEMNSTAFCRNVELRCLQDISKRSRDNLKDLVGQPNYQPSYLNGINNVFFADGHQSLLREKNTESNITTINTEVQAVVETISREVATLPRVEPSKISVAVPFSPISSSAKHCPGVLANSAFKSVQTNAVNIPKKNRKCIQATSSSIELLNVDRWQCNERRGRKSKSQEELRTQKCNFRKEMLQLLQGIHFHDDEFCQAFKDELARKIKKNKRKVNPSFNERAKSTPFWFNAGSKHCTGSCNGVQKLPIETSFANALKDWLQEIVTEKSNILKQQNIDQVINSFATKLKHLCSSSQEMSISKIKQMIEDMTFDTRDSDRNIQLKNLASALTNKFKDLLNSTGQKHDRYKLLKQHTKTNKHSDYFSLKQIIQPTEEEVRGFIREELLYFMNKFHFKLNSRSMYDVETDMIDVLIDSIVELQWGDSGKVKEEIAIVLQETSKMDKYFIIYMADAVVKHFKSFMCVLNANNMNKAEQQNFVVLQNTVQNTDIKSNDITDVSIEPVTEADTEAHIEKYTSQLTQVIEAWWTQTLGDDENEKGFREVAINDLAGDIVDRHRFLDMDTSKPSSEEEEVEYLKFQIFRWINKLVGDEAMQQALDRAPELMEQIQRIPVPLMRIPESLVHSHKQLKRSRSSVPAPSNSLGRAPPTKPDYKINQPPVFGPAECSGNIADSSKKNGPISRRMSESAAYSLRPKLNAVNRSEGRSDSPQGRRYSGPANIAYPPKDLNSTEPSIPKIKNEFENYLYNWVDEIPIFAQEQDSIKKLRRGIYHGVLRALAKADIDSMTARNDIYLQDLLEEELEKLLSCLPSSPELASKKILLKKNLINQATQRTKATRIANSATSYRYRLWEAITSTLPPRPIVEDGDKSAAHIFEEFLKLNLAEDYLLHKLHTGMNLPKAYAYKEKVLISLQKLYDNAKLLPSSDGIVSDEVLKFSEKIYNAMIKVNRPTRDILEEEGDQIVLGHEISQWLQDLPILHSYDPLDQLQARILRDSLAIKIHEIEKQTNLRDNSAVKQVKNELYKFLEKFSPNPEEAGNLSFLIDEFINKLKNRREIVQRPINFPAFFINVPYSSSFVENSGSIIISDSLEDSWGNRNPSRAVSKASPYKKPTNAQWLTMLDTREKLQRESEAQAPSAQAQQIPSCCQPAVAMSFRSQEVSNKLNHDEDMSYREPSNIEWLTLLNTQEQIEQQKRALEARAPPQQIPPCCQPAIKSQIMGNHSGHSQQISNKEPSNVEWLTLLNTQENIEREKKAIEAHAQSQQIPPCCHPNVAVSQRVYGAVGLGQAVFEPQVGANARSLHTSGATGVSYHPMSDAGKLIGAPANASEMRRLVDLQDHRLPMMHNAIPTVPPDPSGGTSFAQQPDQPVMQIPIIPNIGASLGTSRMPIPSIVARPKLAEPRDPCTRGAPMAQSSDRLRINGSPQQVMSGGSAINQSQVQFRAPLGQPEAIFSTRHNLAEIHEHNASRPMMSPPDLSIQIPVGFSTPRRSLVGKSFAPVVPDIGNAPRAPRPRRKRTLVDVVRPEAARRRLLEEVEDEEEQERDEVHCRCTERVYRCRRRRPMCCDCEDMDYPKHYPMPYSCFF